MSTSRRNTFRPRLRRLEDRLAPAAGMLDPTFGGGDGMVTTAYPVPTDSRVGASAVDSTGRIVAAGIAYGGQFTVVRYSVGGAFDPTFGVSGQATFDFGSGTFPRDVVIDALDRVVIAFSSSSSDTDFGVIRLTSAGELDATFDGDGKITIDFGSSSETPFALTTDSAGRIIVAGSTSEKAALARLSSTGALDTSFDGDGKLLIEIDGTSLTSDYPTKVAVDSLDRIIITGSIYNGASTIKGYAARLTTSGGLDTSFNSDGMIVEDGNAFFGTVDALDRIILARYGSTNVSMTRLTVAGELDVTFDGDGNYSFDAGNSESVSDVDIDSLGRIFVGCTTQTTSGNYQITVARLNANGGLNLSISFGFGANGAILSDMAVDNFDRVVVAGILTINPGLNLAPGFAIARLAKNGPLDFTFDGDGRAVTQFLRSNSAADQVATDSLGRIIIGGSDGTSNLIVRYTADGVVDTTFGTGGKFVVGSSLGSGFAMAVDAQDRVVISSGSLVQRLTTTGALDKSFDGYGKVTLNPPPYTGYLHSYYVFSMNVKSTGAIVITSSYSYVWGTWGPYQYTSCNLAVTQLTSTGALDTSFGTNGTVTFGYSSGQFGYAPPPPWLSITSDSKNRVLFWIPSAAPTTISRLTTTGALDSNFDTDGIATIDLGVRSLETDSQDRVIITNGSVVSGVYTNTVTRLTATGVPDITFDGDGFAQPNVPTGLYPRAVIDGQNRILLSAANWMARLNSNGSNDATFGTGGQTTIGFDGVDIAVDKAGRPVVVGSASINESETAMAVARFTSDASSTLKAAVQINDGAAQRSMDTSLKVTLSEPVTFPSGIAAAFQLQRTGPGTPTGLVILDLEQTGNMVDVTFNDPTYAPGLAKSLIDGRYTLTLIASKIQGAIGFLDANADGIGGDNFLLSLHRLFGDSDGNATVDQNDFIAFRNGFNNGPSQFFDFDGDGQVNQSDFIQFRNRFNASI